MNLVKDRYILFFIFFTPIILFSLTTVAIEFNQSTIAESFNEDDIINYEYFEMQTTFKTNFIYQEFPIFGYRLKVEDTQPIIRDENGLLIIKQDEANYVDVTLKLQWNNFEIKRIPIIGTRYSYKNGVNEFYYEITDIYSGLFMTMGIYAEIIYVDLAFDDGSQQYCYNGLISKGDLIPNLYLNQQIKVVYLDIDRKIEPINVDYEIQLLKDLQISSLSITQNVQKVGIRGTYPEHYNYGIAHECADFETVNLAEDLPDDYWEPYTGIDYGIYRRIPTKVQVQSDLQYYCENNFLCERDIKAYAMYAHSNDAANTAWLIRVIKRWWGWTDYIWLTPSEVSSLWYSEYDPQTGDDISVYPTNMIIHATVCYGYSGDDGIPHMAKAFVDYGAAAFVGATVSVPGLHNDEFTGDFWYDLCQSDNTVYQATISYINTHNLYDDYGTGSNGEDLNIDWVYNNHIKIYGSTSVKLEN